MNNESNLVCARHLEALAQAAKDYTLAELADITLQGGESYSLPTASETVKGGVKVGTGLSMSGDTLNVTLTAGESYTLPTASTTVKGGVKVGTGLSMNGDTLNCTISGGGATYSVATTTQAGLMSALDKQHLDAVFQDSTDFVDTVLAGVSDIFFPAASTAQDVIAYNENFKYLDNKYIKLFNQSDYWNAISYGNKDNFYTGEYCIYEEDSIHWFGTSDGDTSYRASIATARNNTMRTQPYLIKVDSDHGVIIYTQDSVKGANYDDGKSNGVYVKNFAIKSTGVTVSGANPAISTVAGYTPSGEYWGTPEIHVIRSLNRTDRGLLFYQRYASATTTALYTWGFTKTASLAISTTTFATIGTMYDDIPESKTDTTWRVNNNIPKPIFQTDGDNVKLSLENSNKWNHLPFLFTCATTYNASQVATSETNKWIFAGGFTSLALKTITSAPENFLLACKGNRKILGGFMNKQRNQVYLITISGTDYIPKTTGNLIKTLFDNATEIYTVDPSGGTIVSTSLKLSDIIDDLIL